MRTREWTRISARWPRWALMAVALLTLGYGGPVWAELEYKPLPAQQETGAPVHISVAHQPYYTQSWTSSVVKFKELWKKYLPPGSTVTFEIALAGAPAVNMVVGDKAQYAYGGDAPMTLGMTIPRSRADIRGAIVVGYSNCCHCNTMIIRADAPYLKTPEEYVKWLQGKLVGGARTSCNDRWFRQVYKRFGVEPRAHLHQTFEVTRAQFRVGRVDATGIWEPHASGIWLQDHTGRPAATGGSFGMDDAAAGDVAYKFIKENPRAHIAWLKANLEAMLYLSDPKNERELIEAMFKETEGYSKLTLWHSMYGKYPDEVGGTPIRNLYPAQWTPDVKRLFTDVADFLWSIKAIPEPKFDPDDMMEEPVATAAKELGLKLPLHENHAAFNIARPLDQAPFFAAEKGQLKGLPPVVPTDGKYWTLEDALKKWQPKTK